ncbi:MAG: winged helix DNA-binding domain-containing protein [Baekduia sp.]
MDPLTTIRRRLAVQRLSADPLGTPAAVVRWLGAMQGQEYAEVQWSIARRMGEEVTDDVIEEAFASGALVRTHLLRPTWHVVAAADLRWLLALTAPRVHAVNKYWYKKLGLDEALLARGMAVIDRALGDGEARTRTELGGALAGAGIEIDRLALTYMMMYAELEALVCSGPRRGKQQTYMSVDARVPPAPALDREEALVELISRYFRSRGPATVKDFTTWSGLTVADAKAGLALVGDELVCEVDGDGAAWWSAPDAPAAPVRTGAHLVPMYDELTIAYRQARVVLAAQPPRSGLLERPILVDGTTIGSWKRTLTARTVTVEATIFTEPDADGLTAVEDEAGRFGRFLRRSVTLAATPA